MRRKPRASSPAWEKRFRLLTKKANQSNRQDSSWGGSQPPFSFRGEALHYTELVAQSAPKKVLPFAEARRIVEEQARFLLPHEPAAEAVALSRARGRVLAESICADRDL